MHDGQLSLNEIRTIVDNDNFESLLHKFENNVLDVKSELYKFDANNFTLRESEIFEMAKDVSSFANSNGGYLIIGVNEDKNVENSKYNIIKEVLGVDLSSRNLSSLKQQIKDLLISRIAVPINGLSVKFHPIKVKNQNRHIITIFVPKSNKQPHLVLKSPAEKFFGFYKRDENSNELSSINSILSLIQNGHKESQFSRILSELSSINDKVNILEQSLTESGSLKINQDESRNEEKHVPKLLIEKNSKKETEDRWINNEINRDMFFVECSLKSTDRTKQTSGWNGIFSKSKSNLFDKITNYSTPRSHGWDLKFYERPEISSNQITLKSANKYLSISKNGRVQMICGIDNFLARENNSLSISPLALIELIYNFFLILNILAQGNISTINSFEVGILKNTKHPISLQNRIDIFREESRVKATSDVVISIEELMTAGDIGYPEKLSYIVIKNIFHHFGFTDEEIPFVDLKEGIFDLNAIKNI